MTITAKLNVLMGISVLGLVGLFVFSQSTLSQVKVNGALYADIVRGKDIVADILPPPEYVIEARLGVLQMLSETDQRVIDGLVEKGRSLRKDFEDRHAYWDKDLPEGPMRQQLLDDSYRPGVEFFDIRDTQFIPALLRGDHEEAERLANGVMKATYEVHRAAIDRLVVTATEFSARAEATASDVIRNRTLLLTALCLLVVALIGAIGWTLARGIAQRLAHAIAVLEAAAAGDLSQRIQVDGDDELARISVALNDTIQAQERSVQAARDAAAEAQHAAQRERALEQQAAERQQREAEEARERDRADGERRQREAAAEQDRQRFDAERDRIAADEQHRREVAQAEKDRREADELQAKVASILEVVTAASAGDLTCEITVRGTDAVGQMGEALSRFFTNLRANIGDIAQTAITLAAAAEELSATSGTMSSTAEETSVQADLVSAASKNVSLNVNTVSAAAGEMTASIAEIAKTATEATRVATLAVDVAETTNETVAKLGESSAEIGKVVKVITAIAQQTNLLALNATIEAARAGEAGKGFAVVANEVKELAKKTATATEEISGKIEAIQANTLNAVDAIQQIGAIIRQISGLQTTVASAVEEQTATTDEIGRNVGEAARSASEIAENILGVASAALGTNEGAANSLVAATELARMATSLQTLVAQFRYQDADQRGPEGPRAMPNAA